MTRFSYSKLNTFANCPRQYEVEYVEQRAQTSSPEARRGTEVHDCCAEYVRHLVDTGLKTDLDFVRTLGVSLEAREILETFATTHMFEPGEGVYRWETKHVVSLGDAGVEYSGVVDLIENRGSIVYITDYKSFYRALSQTEVTNSLQLRGYALLAAAMFPKAEQFICRMDFVRLGVTRETVYFAEDLDDIEADLLRRVELIESGQEWKPRPGGTCDWCPGKKDCPALASGVEAITSPEDAEALADELIVLKARDKEIQALLKPYCTREGAIARNGLAVGYSTSESYDYPDLGALMEVMGHHGHHDFLDYLKANTTKLKAMTKKDPDLTVDLEDIAVDKSKSTFGIKKGDAS